MTNRQPRTTRLSPSDDVEVALTGLRSGALIANGSVVCQEHMPAGHKVAIKRISAGSSIRKYGHIIGSASREIQPGAYVHTHNMKMKDFARNYAPGKNARPTEFFPEKEQLTFEGIVRPDGQVATRYYIGVLPTVNCTVSVARFIANAFVKESLTAFPSVDGVVSLGHGGGCGMVSAGEGFNLLQRALAGYARHPNFAGILLVGLGCEVNQIDRLMKDRGFVESPFLRPLKILDETRPFSLQRV